jgi:hypothetical protein
MPNITPRGLSREWHFPLAILLHFLYLIFNENGLVDHVLEVSVVGVKQLELNVIIQPTQEHVLLLLVLRYSFTIVLPCFRSVNSFLFSFMVPRGT